MPTRGQYVAQLIAQVGEGEDPPGSNCNRYALHALGVCAPWCAAGLKTCADDIGLDLPGWSGYCPTWEANLRDAGDWFEADQVDQVEPGWAVFFDWYGTDESWHVDLALVHHSPLSPPVHRTPQFSEPFRHRRGVYERRSVDNSPAFIIRDTVVPGEDIRAVKAAVAKAGGKVKPEPAPPAP